jgi:hypothetical protein
MEQPPPFHQGSPRSLRAGLDQTAHDIGAAHEVGLCQHLKQIISTPFIPFRRFPPATLSAGVLPSAACIARPWDLPTALARTA